MSKGRSPLFTLFLASWLMAEPTLAAVVPLAATAPARRAPTTRVQEQALAVGALWMLHAYYPEIAASTRHILNWVMGEHSSWVLAATIIPVMVEAPAVKKKRHVTPAWPPEKVDALWNNPPVNVVNKLSSEEWRRAGYQGFVQAMKRQYGSWGNFLSSRMEKARYIWTPELIEQFWDNPPIEVKNKWNSEDWHRAGYMAFVVAVSRKYGSWEAFIKTKGDTLRTPRTQEAIARVWVAPPKTVTNKWKTTSWQDAGEDWFIKSVMEVYGSWSNFIRMQLKLKKSLLLAYTYNRMRSVWVAGLEGADKQSAQAWFDKGHGEFVQAVVFRFQSWEYGIHQLETDMQTMFHSPPVTVKDPRNIRDWMRAGYGFWVEKMLFEHSGSKTRGWHDFVKSQGKTPLPQLKREAWVEKYENWAEVLPILRAEDAGQISPLQKEIALARFKDRGNLAALDALMATQYDMVDFLVRKYVATHPAMRDHFDDLRQAAMVGDIPGHGGLRRAAELYEADKNLRFSTYASDAIEGSIKRAAKKIYTRGHIEELRIDEPETGVEPVAPSNVHREVEVLEMRAKAEAVLEQVVESPQHRDIFRRILDGDSLGEIAESMGVPEKVVSFVQQSVFTKLRDLLSGSPQTKTLSAGQSALLLVVGVLSGSLWMSALGFSATTNNVLMGVGMPVLSPATAASGLLLVAA